MLWDAVSGHALLRSPRWKVGIKWPSYDDVALAAYPVYAPSRVIVFVTGGDDGNSSACGMAVMGN